MNGIHTMTITLASTAFQADSPIPDLYTGNGRDISPPLKWADVPPETRELALIADDPDAPGGTWVHWVVYKLPAGTAELPEGASGGGQHALPAGTLEGKTSFGHRQYGGPMPPRGKPHRYYFRLYALDQPVNLPAGATKEDLLAAMKGHVLAEGELMGTYQQK